MGAKIAATAVLSKTQEHKICYYQHLNASFEVFYEDIGWLTVDWVSNSTDQHITEMLISLANQYPHSRIRVMDKTTGRMLDFI